MKKQALKWLATACLLLTAATATAYAQTAGQSKADIPFDFTVGDKRFPAGEYVITRINPQSDRAVLLIRSADGRERLIVQTTPVQAGAAREEAKLIFNRYANQRFLSQVWIPADNSGLGLPKSRTERTLQREIERVAPQRLVVALRTGR